MKKIKSFTLEQWLAILFIFNLGILVGIVLMVGAFAPVEKPVYYPEHLQGQFEVSEG